MTPTETKPTAHTPTPWMLSKFGNEFSVDAPCKPVGKILEIARVHREANAAHIVRCVNAHDELLAAAIKTLAFIRDLSESNPGFLGKLVLQDYAQFNEAMIELPKAIRNATATME